MDLCRDNIIGMEFFLAQYRDSSWAGKYWAAGRIRCVFLSSAKKWLLCLVGIYTNVVTFDALFADENALLAVQQDGERPYIA